jgi:predicted DNA-binding helix-hairpin-helix protein
VKTAIGLVLLLVTAGASPSGAKVSPRHLQEAADEVHLMGRVNVNDAAEETLVRVPGLDAATVRRILAERAKAPIGALDALRLPRRAQRYLCTSGPTDFQRIRKLPLVPVADSTPTP